MSHAAMKSSALRRALAIATIVTALFAVAVPPASALGLIRAARDIELSGDRTFVKTNLRVTNTAPSLDLGVYFGIGGSDVQNAVGVRMIQNGSDRESRQLLAYAYGEFRNVQGQACVGQGFVDCERKGFNWIEDRAYQVVLDRGNHTENGWLWTLKITDQKTNEVTPLLTLRSSDSALSLTANRAFLDLSPNNCANINTAAGIVTKPRRQDGSTFGWGANASYEEACASEANTVAPITDTEFRPRISQGVS